MSPVVVYILLLVMTIIDYMVFDWATKIYKKNEIHNLYIAALPVFGIIARMVQENLLAQQVAVDVQIYFGR